MRELALKLMVDPVEFVKGFDDTPHLMVSGGVPRNTGGYFFWGPLDDHFEEYWKNL